MRLVNKPLQSTRQLMLSGLFSIMDDRLTTIHMLGMQIMHDMDPVMGTLPTGGWGR